MNEPEPLACLVGLAVGERADLLVDDLASLPPGVFALKVPGRPAELVRTLAFVERVVPPSVLAAYVECICTTSPYIVPGRKGGEQ